MPRPRNNFSIPRHATALHGVLSSQDIRDMRPGLGSLNARLVKYLRRFTLPVSVGSGPSRKTYIKILDTELSRAPQALQDALGPHLTDDYDALVAQEPWLADEENWTPDHNAKLDQELGSELDADKHPFSWTPPAQAQ